MDAFKPLPFARLLVILQHYVPCQKSLEWVLQPDVISMAHCMTDDDIPR